MKTIKINTNKKVLVDDKFFKILNKFKWYPFKGVNTNYAITYINNKSQTMHKIIFTLLGIKIPKNKMCDHKNGNGLDNRLDNLRIVTPRQNLLNKVKHKNNKSGYKGVFLEKNKKKYRVQIKFRGKIISLGYFTNKKIAAQEYDKAAIKYFKDFAKTNFKNVS